MVDIISSHFLDGYWTLNGLDKTKSLRILQERVFYLVRIIYWTDNKIPEVSPSPDAIFELSLKLYLGVFV